jgi:hypothetical protein
MTDDRPGATPSPDAQWLRIIPGQHHLGRLEAVVDEVSTMRPRGISQGGSRQGFDGNRTMEAGGAANQSDLPKRRIRVTGDAYDYTLGHDVVRVRTCHRGVLCQECTAAPETRRRPETSVESALAGRAGTLLARSEVPAVHGARLEPGHVCPGPPMRVADAAPRLNRQGTLPGMSPAPHPWPRDGRLRPRLVPPAGYPRRPPDFPQALPLFPDGVDPLTTLVADLPRFLRQSPEPFRLASRSLGRCAVFLCRMRQGHARA